MKRSVLMLALLLGIASNAFAFGFRTGQVSVPTSSASEIGSTVDRVSITIVNHDATNPVYCGNSSSVTSSTGLKIGPGVGFTLDYSEAAFTSTPAARASLYCRATGGAVTVSFLEDTR